MLLKNFKKLKQSLLSVIKSKNFWTVDGKPINYSLNKRPRRQDNPGIYIENGAFT